ncbi:DNA-directed RNA polymerase subunit E'' [Candidatus Woesearchaeota archaeon CG10_big_fil_rev_8_21_14_0_10_37_12]|nr:MAG: DNA-directed RNA polymerase subunit E'' [Candidatus Woesearchaeota archaeon CG10_big_fil_rev_8_21_14_0_10_37_12]
MSRKKACKSCKYFYEGQECPLCKSSQTVTNWKGRIHIIDAKESGIAKKIGVEETGEYAIKVN